MATVPSETSSPEVVPAMTKTDARELKSLVSRDTKLLLDELELRSAEYLTQLNTEFKPQFDAITEELEVREKEARKESEAAVKKIVNRVNKLNEAIVETLAELAKEGWRGKYGNHITPHDYVVHTRLLDGLQPPSVDNSDLHKRSGELQRAKARLETEVFNAYNDAVRSVRVQESDMLRDLALQSITTESAREFILEMPAAEELMPPPVVPALTA